MLFLKDAWDDCLLHGSISPFWMDVPSADECIFIETNRINKWSKLYMRDKYNSQIIHLANWTDNSDGCRGVWTFLWKPIWLCMCSTIGGHERMKEFASILHTGLSLPFSPSGGRVQMVQHWFSSITLPVSRHPYPTLPVVAADDMVGMWAFPPAGKTDPHQPASAVCEMANARPARTGTVTPTWPEAYCGQWQIPLCRNTEWSFCMTLAWFPAHSCTLSRLSFGSWLCAACCGSRMKCGHRTAALSLVSEWLGTRHCPKLWFICFNPRKDSTAQCCLSCSVLV